VKREIPVHRNVLVLAPIILIPTALWVMDQWRCHISGGFCGHILIGGILWHFWAALAILAISFSSLSLVLSSRHRTRPLQELDNRFSSIRPLTGLWVWLVWQNVPVESSIHPPNLGGTCPKIPVICHDVPLLGLGGAFWWTAPFFAAAVLGIARYIFAMRAVGLSNLTESEGRS
jgi:hypothetical protein